MTSHMTRINSHFHKVRYVGICFNTFNSGIYYHTTNIIVCFLIIRVVQIGSNDVVKIYNIARYIPLGYKG